MDKKHLLEEQNINFESKDINKIYNGDVLDILKQMPSESVDMCITSPPYWGLRDYGSDGQIGNEETYIEYLAKLSEVFKEVKRILKKQGSCWVNIGDVYSSKNSIGIKKQSLIGIPDRFKINMIDDGWLCRNEIIWHKPNAMPSSAKTRFNNDYEKMFFFTKDESYYFETQYETAKTKKTNKKTFTNNDNSNSKYINDNQEKSVRQGMSKTRGSKIIETRPKLPTQKEFVDFIRSRSTVNYIFENVQDIKKTTIEHWFRKDAKGFSYPTIEDWNKIKYLLDDRSEEFKLIDYQLAYVEYETDDINKNIDKGRLKRAVWSINTKPFKGGHFAPYPTDLVKTPILACCPVGGIVLDIFMGSGTTGLVAKQLDRNYIGIEINKDYIEIAEKRIKEYAEN